jgi:TRAP-type C4-dicarboxylate transport system permease small subunit
VTAIVNFYFRALKALLAFLLAAMVVMVFGNVVLRYAFNSGITVSEELSRWCLVWITFLGATAALREHQHLGVDFVVRMFSRTGRKALLILSHVLMILATVLLLIGSWQQTLLNLDVPAPVTELSTGWFYGVGVVFGVSALIILLHELYRAVTNKMTDEELITVAENEDLAEVAHIEQELVAGARTPSFNSNKA